MFVAAQNLTRLIHGSHLVVAEARAAGLTADMLLSRRFHKIFWDAYVARDIAITPLLRAKAVLKLVPRGSYISHHSVVEGISARASRLETASVGDPCSRIWNTPYAKERLA